MVTVKSYELKKSSEGKDFVALILEGDLELVKSQTTGRFYATVRKTSVSTTFDETTAQRMINKQLPGQIEKVECAPYQWAIPQTGEVITLSHNYAYNPNATNMVETVLG